MRRIAACAVTAAALMSTASATAQTTTAPTVDEARNATRFVLDIYAQALDGRLVIGRCPRRGGVSRVCDARVLPIGERFRVIVTARESCFEIKMRRI